MYRLVVINQIGDVRELGSFPNLDACAKEIYEWELNHSNIGTNVIGALIKAFDLSGGFTYIYTPIDLSQTPRESYDPKHPYDWKLETDV